MEDIGFFFEYENTVVQLPINPSELTIKTEGTNKTMEIISLGQINLLKDVALSELSISSWLPGGTWFPGIRTLGKFEGPEFYEQFFNKIRADKKPCRLIVTGINLNMLVSIESVEFEHRAGEHEDKYYTLNLKEYKPFTIKEAPIQNLANVAAGKVANPPVATQSNRENTEVTIGSVVILNGTVHRDSYGSKPGKTFKNYKCKVNLINKRGTHPYHVTTMDGGWLGWVTKESVKLA